MTTNENDNKNSNLENESNVEGEPKSRVVRLKKSDKLSSKNISSKIEIAVLMSGYNSWIKAIEPSITATTLAMQSILNSSLIPTLKAAQDSIASTIIPNMSIANKAIESSLALQMSELSTNLSKFHVPPIISDEILQLSKIDQLYIKPSDSTIIVENQIQNKNEIIAESKKFTQEIQKLRTEQSDLKSEIQQFRKEQKPNFVADLIKDNVFQIILLILVPLSYFLGANYS